MSHWDGYRQIAVAAWLKKWEPKKLPLNSM